jgi:putative methionine-R-sulfoxide reductase with GAF domain
VTLGTQPWAGVLEAVDRILNREREADEVLRQTVTVLAERIARYAWVGLYFVEGDELALGPRAGTSSAGRERIPLGIDTPIGAAVAERRTVGGPGRDQGAAGPPELDVPVLWEGQAIAVFNVDASHGAELGEDDRVFLERVALLVSAHCLVGWDTGGVDWEDVA